MPHYTIKTLEIGYDRHFPAGVAFDFWYMAADQVYSPFSMTLLQGEGCNILFDCGFDPASPFAKSKIEAEGDENCRNPREVLSQVGLCPEDIDAIVLSHCHWDHMSGLGFFPNAKIYVQRQELERWVAAMNDADFPLTHKSVVDAESLIRLQCLQEQGNVTLLDGSVDNLFPGIHVRCAAGHSFAQTLLFIEDDNGKFVLAGDAAMRPESFTGTEQFPCFLPNLKFSVGSILDITASYRLILDWVQGDVSHIVLSHDGTRRDKSPTEQGSLGLNISLVNP